MIFDKKILEKDPLKIVITDSGLGGLSVQALLDREVRKQKIDISIEIIFYNSVAHHDYGYNTMKDHDEKVRVFNSAFNGLLKLNPDIILIACNTLSVLYHHTQVSKKINSPVLGLVDLGVELILENITQDGEYNIILFGTETTITSNQHKLKLESHGINEFKIVTQACRNLESEIQINPQSDGVKFFIEKYMDEIIEKMNNGNKKVLAVLCCTHYGYSKDIFQDVLNNRFGKKVCVLNPNEKMADVVVNSFKTKKKGSSKISNQVLSKVNVIDSEMEKLSELLYKDSPSVSNALINYKYDRSLFNI